MPALSVLLPTFNGATHLQATIESILVQTFDDFELLISDDGSVDATLEIISRFDDPRIRLQRNATNVGLPNNMNISMARANGEFLARVDHDDLPRADRFERQIGFLRANPHITIVGSQIEHFDEQVCTVSCLPADDATIKARFVSGANYLANQAAMGRADFYRSHRLQYDANLYVVDDLGFWFDCLLCGAQFANLPEPLTRYRIHRGMTSYNIDPQRLDNAKARLYRRVIPTYFPSVDGSDCEAILELYKIRHDASWQVEEMIRLHEIIGRVVHSVDTRWGQCPNESRNQLLAMLNRARTAFAAADAVNTAQFEMLDRLFGEATLACH